MSGGFFRGTSADQDTRFSNKQAKLLKSQKFAPELEHLVDMRKVKMDVMRPWIATRVTELLGFEDEVLINFIYGLLDGKQVNGKEVQISLTGFMEKNTGKFMKELWTLLLSAQKNESGVPQQFLDAKAEETRKKQAEADRITNEIQKKIEKESRELEQERSRKMDNGEAKDYNAAKDPATEHLLLKGSSGRTEDEKETDKRNGARGRNRVSRSPRSADRSSSSPRGLPSRISKSFSNSRSYSGDGNKSRSVSGSPEARRQRSSSFVRVYRSPRKRSITPRRRHSPRNSLSPPRRRSSYSRQRSRSLSRRKSPSPVRRRVHSPFRRRSPFLVHRRSPSPVRRRTPVRRRRSPPPMRRRSPSPMRRRSPSPVRRRSPSPARRRSPPSLRRRSPSPLRRRYQRSPSTPIRRSGSPMRRRSPVPSRKRSPAPYRCRSPSPYGSSSSSPVRRKSPPLVRGRSPKEHRRLLVQSPPRKVRTQEKLSPVSHRASSSRRSPLRDHKDQKDLRNKLPASSPLPRISPIQSESPLTRNRSASEDGRSPSPNQSPVRQRREQITHDGSLSPRRPRDQKPHIESPETSKELEAPDHTWERRDSRSSQKRSTYSSTISKQKDTTVKVDYKDEQSAESLAGRRATESRSHADYSESRKKDEEAKSGKSSGRAVNREYSESRKKDEEAKSGKSSGRGVNRETRDGQKSQTLSEDSLLGERQQTAYKSEGQKSDERNRSHLNNVKDNDKVHKSETTAPLVEKVDHDNGKGAFDSGSEESEKYRSENKDKLRHKRAHRQEVASDDEYSYDSEIEERKQAKRRRKEERKLRKEEKRRRREERRRRREQRRAEKLKSKHHDDSNSSDDEHVGRRESHPSDEETASQQKRLEIELRKKALESLKAKKAISR